MFQDQSQIAVHKPLTEQKSDYNLRYFNCASVILFWITFYFVLGVICNRKACGKLTQCCQAPEAQVMRCNPHLLSPGMNPNFTF